MIPSLRSLIHLMEGQSTGLRAVWQAVDASGSVTEGIEAAEAEWRGGIADLGNAEAGALVQRMPGYPAYAQALRAALAAQCGFPLVVYRTMPIEAAQDFIASPYSTTWATSVDAKIARRFAGFAGHKAGEMALLAITLRDPQSIVMRGKLEEGELVIDTGWIAVPEDDVALL